MPKFFENLINISPTINIINKDNHGDNRKLDLIKDSYNSLLLRSRKKNQILKNKKLLH